MRAGIKEAQKEKVREYHQAYRKPYREKTLINTVKESTGRGKSYKPPNKTEYPPEQSEISYQQKSLFYTINHKERRYDKYN